MLTESECLLSLMCECVTAIFIDRRQSKPLLACKVRAHVLERLANKRFKPDLEGTAAHFNISAPTLRRKLRTEGTSHQQIVDEIRFELAKKLLLRGLLMDEISYDLGFSASSGFSRFFKDFCGIAPLKWVDQQRG